MVERFPHLIKYRPFNTNFPYQDEATGQWITNGATQGAEVVLKAMAEPNGRGIKVPNKNGQMVDFSWMIYLPAGMAPIDYDTEITITDKSGTFIGKGKVQRFFNNGGFNTQIWL